MLPPPKPDVVAVVGPTATGKTIIGAQLAKHFGSEVISVDSQLVYQDLSIGVARPTEAEMLGIPHHMIGIVSPETAFSAGDYAELARPLLEKMIDEKRIPVLVGGTGFYLRALLQPEHLPQVPVNPEIRKRLKQRIQQEGESFLYETLKEADPDRAEEIHPNDTVRLIRALEIIELTGKPIEKTPLEPSYPILTIGLMYVDRECHLRKIRSRLKAMMDEGFLEEVQELYSRYGLCYALTKAHGYPELVEVITGKRTLESAMTQIEVNIRQYSKRQMTWFRRFPNIIWYAVDEQSPNEIITDVIRKYI
jgi:tRNA dimethylallyltransferase